jgi:hypothetical protein
MRTNTITSLPRLTNLEQYTAIAGYVRSITFTKEESKESPDQSNASEAHDQENTTSPCNRTLWLPFKRLVRLTVLHGQPFLAADWSDKSDTSTGQLENLRTVLERLCTPVRTAYGMAKKPFFSLSKAAEIGQLWGSLTILRLRRFRLTLRCFVAGEAMLQWLFSLPRFRSISNARMCLDDHDDDDDDDDYVQLGILCLLPYFSPCGRSDTLYL